MLILPFAERSEAAVDLSNALVRSRFVCKTNDVLCTEAEMNCRCYWFQSYDYQISITIFGRSENDK